VNRVILRMSWIRWEWWIRHWREIMGHWYRR